MRRPKQAVRTAAGCFPRYAGEIEQAYEQSGEFRSICADLHDCCGAVTYWNEVDTHEGAARREEYGAMLEGLQREMLEWLGAHGFFREDEVSG